MGVLNIDPRFSLKFLALALLMLTGCAHPPGKLFNGIHAPQGAEVVAYIYSAQTGCIDLGQMNAEILINDKPAFTLAENTYVRLVLPPGNYTFAASTDDQMACHGRLNPGKFWPDLSFELTPASVYFLRYNAASNRCIATCDRHLERVSEQIAAEELKGTISLPLSR